MADPLKDNPFILRTESGEVMLISPLVYEHSSMKVQDFLVAKRSGLASVKWSAGLFSGWTAATWIDSIAQKYRIRPQYILTVLQAEQSLVTDRAVRNPLVEVKALPDRTLTPPQAPGPDWKVRRNGGYWDSKNAGNANYSKKTPDENWWIAWRGDWKMVAATGAGILGPDDWPSWDMRKYLGFANQIEAVGALTAKYMVKYADAVAMGNVAARTIVLQDGSRVVAGDPEAFVLLNWTNNAEVLAVRPTINKEFSA